MIRNDEMKLHTLTEFAQLLESVNAKVDVLAALDADVTASGVGDLHDQLTSMRLKLSDLVGAVERAFQVVPVVK